MPLSLLAHLHLRRGRGLRAVLLVALALAGLTPATALAASATRVVSYHGYRLVVPAGWPVYRLQAGTTACVRFNRHAVYLGDPSQNQQCPATAAGRTEALLVSPLRPSAGRFLPPTSATGATRDQASEAQIINTRHGVVVTATWNRNPAVIQRALGLRSMSAAVAASQGHRPASAVAFAQARSRAFEARAVAAAVSTPGEIYTGTGFDACSTPSSTQMSAWDASSYRAIGVYIGGANMACSQPNLSATWVTQEAIDGWHLIPIYVGLQAPSNSCGCASMSTTPATAAAQGTAAALDAVTDAQAIGLGAGNPLYLDMESYNRTTTNSSSVLAFISAWTTQLHASGYASGVYSSSDSGVEDLVAEYGTGYAEPDDIWIANWNNQQSTADPNAPSTDWALHQRLHQYDGAHNETYGGVRINIDGDYVDAATAAAGTASSTVATTPTPAAAPSLSVTAGLDGSVAVMPSWQYATGITAWQVIAGTSPASLTWVGPAVSASAQFPLVTRNAFPYYAVEALGVTGQVVGTSAPVADPAHLAIFGSSVFVPRHGLGAVPVGCYGISPCTLTTTIYVGRTTLSTTGPEHLTTSDGLAYFQLTARAKTLLLRATHQQMAVKVKIRDAAGTSVTRPLTLTSFATSDPNPPRSIGQSSPVRLVGATDFVSHGWFGGILAGCSTGQPCQTTGKIVTAGRVIARTKATIIGSGELAYLFFSMTAAGHKLLAHAQGNQLGATVTLTNTGTSAAPTPSSGAGAVGAGAPVSPAPGATATARIALVSFP
jgi:Domain of unknown function (DUF1906)